MSYALPVFIKLYSLNQVIWFKEYRGCTKTDTGESKEQDFRVGKKEIKRFVSPLENLSSTFSVLGLCYNSVSCRKMVTVQMTLLHRNADNLCLAGTPLSTASCRDAWVCASICKLTTRSQAALWMLCWLLIPLPSLYKKLAIQKWTLKCIRI